MIEYDDNESEQEEGDDHELAEVHQRSLKDFDLVQSTLRDERIQCLNDRRFCTIAGAQWEGPLEAQYENKPKFEVDKTSMSIDKIEAEYRNNRITVDFKNREDSNSDLASICDGLFRADEQDSSADEAYDNAFDEAVKGGIGAFRLRACYEDEYDGENDNQRVKIEPIFDADTSVYFNLEAKRQDKADAKKCWVLSSMTTDAYKEEWDDDPATWPKEVHDHFFDWTQGDVVYVAEYYEVKETTKKVLIYENLEGEEERYHEDEFKADPELKERIEATGSVKLRTRKVKDCEVHKYIMSGAKVLEDCGLIAGKNIPIIQVFGKRSYIDNIERCRGHVRKAKDAQRLKNMQLSKLGEISSLGSVEKPIFDPAQVAGHEEEWADDNIKNYPYLLANTLKDAEGNIVQSGPIGYTKAPEIPPALGALLSVTEQDIKEILGDMQQGEKMLSNIAEETVALIQTRLDGHAFLYISNMAKAIKRTGEVWLSIAKDIYVENGRKMKTISNNGDIETIELMQKTFNDNGEFITKNDLSKASMLVTVDVGPSSSTKKESIVKKVTGMMQFTQDQQTLDILNSLAMKNLEGEGMADVAEFYRKKLLRMGIGEPNEKDKEELAAEQEAAAQNPDPNAEYLKKLAAAEESKALLNLAKAEETGASTALKEAQTQETLAGIDRDDLQATVKVLETRNQATVQPSMSEF